MRRTYGGLRAPLDVKPGELVLVRNSRIEMEMNRKHKPRWLGPYVVVRRHFGGSYLLAELDRAIIADRIAAARIRLYYPRVGMRYNVSRILADAPDYVVDRALGPQAVDDEDEEDNDEGNEEGDEEAMDESE